MKVLHIWNTAGISSILSKYLRKRGITSDVIQRQKFDIFKYNNYYQEKYYLNGFSETYAFRCLLESRNYDILHVHSLMKIIPKLRFLYPRKKIVFHAHGTELRNNYKYYSKHIKNNIDCLIIATPDLYTYDTNSKYLPNPVDIELFNNSIPDNDNMFTFNNDILDMKQIKYYTKLEYDIIDRILPYRGVPNLLHSYGKYLDVKILKNHFMPIKALSTSGLQALSCGLKVIRYDLKEISGLPEQHKPENVINELLEIYSCL